MEGRKRKRNDKQAVPWIYLKTFLRLSVLLTVFLWFILSGEEDPPLEKILFWKIVHHWELAGLGAFLPLYCVLINETYSFAISFTAVQGSYHEKQPAHVFSPRQAGRCHPRLCWYTCDKAQWVVCHVPLKAGIHSPSTHECMHSPVPQTSSCSLLHKKPVQKSEWHSGLLRYRSEPS